MDNPGPQLRRAAHRQRNWPRRLCASLCLLVIASWVVSAFWATSLIVWQVSGFVMVAQAQHLYEQQRVDPRIDPITLEVVRYSLVAIMDETEANLTRTSFSMAALPGANLNNTSADRTDFLRRHAAKRSSVALERIA